MPVVATKSLRDRKHVERRSNPMLLASRAAFRAAFGGVLVLGMLGGLVGCGGQTTDSDGDKKSRNELTNAGFESGKKGWTVPESPDWTSFTTDEKVVKEGKKSAYLKVRSEGEDHSQIFGAVQDVSPDRFPNSVSGQFRVNTWEQATKLQYIQAIIIAESTDLEGDFVNHQIHYVLGGIDEQPYELTNGKFVIVNKGKPKTGKWIKFDRDLEKDFKKLWGAVPKEFSSIRLVLEVRYEGRAPDEPAAAADVYFDQVFLGSK